MKAIVYSKYGKPDVLELRDVPVPTPKEDEVLVKVHAVSLNDWDVAMLDGDFINRLLNGFRQPRIQILGSDVAGTVEALGSGATKFKKSDGVYGDLSGRWGGFAEYVCAPEKSLAPIPASMSYEQAAAIPQAGMLAVQGLIDKGKIQSGQKILVNGAGGGVGMFAIQLSKEYDVEMTGVDKGSKLEFMRSMGYHHVIDYTKHDFTRIGKQYDLILDVKTNRSMFSYARALRPGGRYVTVGGDLRRLLQTLLISPWLSIFSNKKLSIVALKANKDLLFMNEQFEAGKIKPVMDGRYELKDVPEAFRLFGKGKQKGKIVVSLIR
jgi:NADPH:quinone reductase-like Zn-dependent oxidoreductase